MLSVRVWEMEGSSPGNESRLGTCHKLLDLPLPRRLRIRRLDLVLAAILSVGIVGLALDKGLAALESRLLRWRPQASWSSSSARAS